MELSRRRLIAVSALTGGVPAAASLATPASAAPLSTFGVDATQLGVRAGGGADQTAMLQAAIDKAAGARVPLMLGPGEYRAAGLKLPSGAQIVGVRGATKLVFARNTLNAALISAAGAEHITLAGLVLDGADKPLPENSALAHFKQCSELRIIDCEIVNSGRAGILLDAVQGAVTGNTIVNSARRRDLFARRPRVTISGNTVRGAGNGGIMVHRSQQGDDGTLDPRQPRGGHPATSPAAPANSATPSTCFAPATSSCAATASARAAFSAVRGNAASNIQITGNTATDVGEVAIYSEFGFEGAVIANNTVDGAALGIAVVNFNEGGRLAVVQGNLVRNLKRQASGRHRSERRRGYRHCRRSRRRGERQRDRGGAGRGHQASAGARICAMSR